MILTFIILCRRLCFTTAVPCLPLFIFWSWFFRVLKYVLSAPIWKKRQMINGNKTTNYWRFISGSERGFSYHVYFELVEYLILCCCCCQNCKTRIEITLYKIYNKHTSHLSPTLLCHQDHDQLLLSESMESTVVLSM